MTSDFRIRILFFLFLGATTGMYLAEWISGWMLLLPIGWYALLVTLAVCRVSMQFYYPIICQGDNNRPCVALTFDDGPLPGATDRILDILKAAGVPATFFCIGERVAAHPHAARRIVADGHIIANHSHHHPKYFALQCADTIAGDLTSCSTAIAQATGCSPRFFRPPNGVSTPMLAKAVKRVGLTAIGWSLRSFDTTKHDPEKLAEAISRRVAGGDILLFHDYCEITVKALPQIITSLRAAGFTFVPLTELIAESPYFGNPEFSPWGKNARENVQQCI